MKKFSKIILSLVLALVLVSVSMISSFAANTLVINGNEASVGSTVTYTFSISDTQQNLCGMHLVLFFDQELLELTDVNTDNVGGGTIVNDNQGNNGRIIITNSFINGTEGLDCSEKTDIVTATFEVLKEGTTDITYYMPYLYDIDTVNIYDYTFTCNVTVDGQVVVDNQTPVLENVAEIEDFGDAGDFENNEEGTGSGVKPSETEASVTNGENSTEEPNGKSGMVLPIVCVCVIVAAIITLVVVKSLTGKKSKNSDDD